MQQNAALTSTDQLTSQVPSAGHPERKRGSTDVAAAPERWHHWRAHYGPWAVVTGASSGIGLEIAREIARRGVNVVLAARRVRQLESLGEELQRDCGVDVRIVAVDLSTESGVNRLKEQTGDLEIGLLVANAGFGSSGPFLDQQADGELNLVDLNVRSVTAQAHHFLQPMRQRRSGGLVLLSSILAWQGVPGAASYAASKAYVQSLAEALRLELKPFNVDVLSAAPAQVDTGFNDRANLRSPGSEPAAVARNILDHLGRRTTVYPHFRGWFLTRALSMLPRFARVRVLGGVMAGMTRHQRGGSG